MTLIMYKQGKAHCMLSWPGAANCFRLFTLLLMTPHCSRAISTLFLSENILRMLKDRDPESAASRSLSHQTQHKGGSGRETNDRKGKKKWKKGDWSLCRGRKRLATRLRSLTSSRESCRPDSPAASALCICSHKQRCGLLSIFHMSFSIHTNTHCLRFEEEDVPRCILGKYVCCQSEQLICPNLEKHTSTAGTA